MNDPLSAVIAFFVVLIPLILIHELGHFVTAKSVGITILEFAIGFPPRIKRLFTWGETEFTLNWIPLGGFVRPLGEDMIRPLDEETVQKEREALIARQTENDQPYHSDLEEAKARGIQNPKTVNEIRPLGRIFFLAGGAIANFLLAFVLFFVIAVTGIPQSVGGSVGIVSVTPESALAEAGIQNGDLITDINGAKFTDSQSFWNTYYNSETPLTVTLLRGQESEEIEIVVPPPTVQQFLPSSYAQILGVVPDAPGEQAGMQPGDVVLTFNDHPINGVEDFRTLTRENVGKEVSLTLRRGNETLDIILTPRANPPEGQGAIGILIGGILEDRGTGLLYQEGNEQLVIAPQPLGDSIRYGVDRVVSVITMTVEIPQQLISGALTPEEARPVSVVGMSQIGAVVIQQSIDQGRLSPILDFIAVISVALGFFNLLPIPALDGGRILFVLVEIVRGRPISPEREGLVHLVGLALLLSLSVLVILNDVINPIMNSLP
ncbi:MAG: RIP metalloprotease RseP [Anaerolineae bacterium]|nr:RIP metalloprotease RseP [Anaerolineae bacterium]